jgi:hypothetical protein
LQSGAWRDLAFIVVSRLASPTSRLGRLIRFGIGVDCADRGWQDTERNSLFAFRLFLAAGAVGASLAVSTFRSVSTLKAIATAVPAGALTGLDFDFLLVGFGFGSHFVFAIRLISIVVAGTALCLLLLETRAAFLEHAKIVIGVLEVIFGLDPVAGKLRVTREALVFLKQLGGVAALAVVLAASAAVTRHSLRALSTAATTTAALTIVDQVLFPCRTGAGLNRSPQIFPSAEVWSRRGGSARAIAQVDPPFAVKRICESAAMSSGVGGGGASISWERPRP